MKGSCLCGAIEVTTLDQANVDVCHCTTCRRWGSGPMLAVHCGSDVVFGGKQKPSTYQSSDWAERGFCSTCGTHLFYHLFSPDEYVLSAGLFQQGVSFEMSSQIFIEQKPDYYDFANETPTMTGEQAFAHFSEHNN